MKKPSIGESSVRLQTVCRKVGVDYLVIMGRKCPKCKIRTRFASSTEVYKKDYGDIYICDKCCAYVGCHKGTTKAFGRVGKYKLRKKKQKCHKLFDRMWKRKMVENPDWSKTKCRRKAYKWLSKEMKIPVELTHIGMFDNGQCQQVIELCQNYS